MPFARAGQSAIVAFREWLVRPDVGIDRQEVEVHVPARHFLGAEILQAIVDEQGQLYVADAGKRR